MRSARCPAGGSERNPPRPPTHRSRQAPTDTYGSIYRNGHTRCIFVPDRHNNDCDCRQVHTMNTPTRLDQLLYAWLAEPDEAKFERAFAQYYEVAYTAVVR